MDQNPYESPLAPGPSGPPNVAAGPSRTVKRLIIALAICNLLAALLGVLQFVSL